MSDFMKKYLPFYILWILFIMFLATGLQISTAAFSAELPTGSDFNLQWFKNTANLFFSIVTFRGDGFPTILASLAFYLPSIPLIVWIIELVVQIIPF